MIPLMFIVAGAHLVETVLGFGATLLTLSFGTQYVKLSTLMAVLILLGIVQGLWSVVSEHRHIQWRYLARISVACIVGTLIGIAFRDQLGFATLRRVVGLIVVALVFVQYLRIWRGSDAEPLSKLQEYPILLLAGLCHGLLACGGPLVIYCAQRTLDRDAQIRSTLGCLWLILNIPLLMRLIDNPAMRDDIVPFALQLLPVAIAGIALGTMIRIRLHNAQQKFGYLVLGLCGALLGTN